MYGKWKEAEFNYAKFLIYSYHDGCLPNDLIILARKNSMLSFLTNLMNCSKMRIVKKFSGDHKYLGKMRYIHIIDPEESNLLTYKHLYEKYHMMQVISSNSINLKLNESIHVLNRFYNECLCYIPINETKTNTDIINNMVIEEDWWNKVY